MVACEELIATVDIVPFQPWHLEWLSLQESQMVLSPLLTRTYGHALATSGPCYSAFVGNQVIACAGVVEFWTGRAQAVSYTHLTLPTNREV